MSCDASARVASSGAKASYEDLPYKKAAIGKLARRFVYGVHSLIRLVDAGGYDSYKAGVELRLRNRLPECAIETVIQKWRRSKESQSSGRVRHARERRLPEDRCSPRYEEIALVHRGIRGACGANCRNVSQSRIRRVLSQRFIFIKSSTFAAIFSLFFSSSYNHLRHNIFERDAYSWLFLDLARSRSYRLL